MLRLLFIETLHVMCLRFEVWMDGVGGIGRDGTEKEVGLFGGLERVWRALIL